MSIEALNWAYRQAVKPAPRKFLLVTLANYASGDFTCYPSQGKLVELTGLSERPVRDHLAALESLGLIVRQARYGAHGGRTSDVYRLAAGVGDELAVKPAKSAGNPPAKSAGNPPAESAGTPRLNQPVILKKDTKEENRAPSALAPEGAPPAPVEQPSERVADAWAVARGLLAGELGAAKVEQWFAEVECTGDPGGRIQLEAPSRFVASWIASRYRDSIMAAWRTIDARACAVEITVKSEGGAAHG